MRVPLRLLSLGLTGVCVTLANLSVAKHRNPARSLLFCALTGGAACCPGAMGVGYVRLGLNVPGRSTRAYVTLPARIALCLWRFVKQYPSLLYDALKHAIQKRLSDGLPSLILCKGGAPLRNHQADGIYMASAVHDQPFDEPRLRAAFESLAADSPGLGVDKVELVFEEDKPAAEWPTGGSWQPHVLNPTFPHNSNMYEYWGRIGNPSGYFRRLRVFNGLPGKPTVVHYQEACSPTTAAPTSTGTRR